MIHFNMNSTKVFYIIPTNWGQSKIKIDNFFNKIDTLILKQGKKNRIIKTTQTREEKKENIFASRSTYATPNSEIS